MPHAWPGLVPPRVTPAFVAAEPPGAAESTRASSAKADKPARSSRRPRQAEEPHEVRPRTAQQAASRARTPASRSSGSTSPSWSRSCVRPPRPPTPASSPPCASSAPRPRSGTPPRAGSAHAIAHHKLASEAGRVIDRLPLPAAQGRRDVAPAWRAWDGQRAGGRASRSRDRGTERNAHACACCGLRTRHSIPVRPHRPDVPDGGCVARGTGAARRLTAPGVGGTPRPTSSLAVAVCPPTHPSRLRIWSAHTETRPPLGLRIAQIG